MAWQPTKKQISLMIDMNVARMPANRITEALGIDQDEFKAWTARLAATRSMPMPAAPAAQVAPTPDIALPAWMAGLSR